MKKIDTGSEVLLKESIKRYSGVRSRYTGQTGIVKEAKADYAWVLLNDGRHAAFNYDDLELKEVG